MRAHKPYSLIMGFLNQCFLFPFSKSINIFQEIINISIIQAKMLNGAGKSSLLSELSNKHFCKGHLSPRSSQTDSMLGTLACCDSLDVTSTDMFHCPCMNRISVVEKETCGFHSLKATVNNSLPTCLSNIKMP